MLVADDHLLPERDSQLKALRAYQEVLQALQQCPNSTVSSDDDQLTVPSHDRPTAAELPPIPEGEMANACNKRTDSMLQVKESSQPSDTTPSAVENVWRNEFPDLESVLLYLADAGVGYDDLGKSVSFPNGTLLRRFRSLSVTEKNACAGVIMSKSEHEECCYCGDGKPPFFRTSWCCEHYWCCCCAWRYRKISLEKVKFGIPMPAKSTVACKICGDLMYVLGRSCALPLLYVMTCNWCQRTFQGEHSRAENFKKS